MPHLDNDMDELFQKAGEYYSPQKGAGDWESIAKRLASKSDSSPFAAPAGKRKKILLTVTLLLTGLFIGGYLFKNNLAKIFYSNTDKVLSKTSTGEVVSAAVENREVQFPIAEKGFVFQAAKNKHSNYTKNSKPLSVKRPGKVISAIPLRVLYSNIAFKSWHEKHSGGNVADENNYRDLAVLKTSKEKASEIFSKKVLNNTREISDQLKITFQKSIHDLLQETDTAQQVYKYALAKNNTRDNKFISGKSKNFYLGLVAGIDFSRVRSRTFTYPKYSAGVVFGLQSTSGLSFETGAIFTRKNYKSEGRYFKMGKVRSGMPGGMIINDLEGQSALIEIPIKVKYDVISKRNAGVFIAGGLSSYLMIKERNIYNVTLNGGQQTITGVYNKSHFLIPAVVSISLGYEYKVSKSLKVRLEPFVKIPLQGIGIGSLPVTSAGLQVGFTRSLK
ncbi:MAG: hypothetical protein ABIR81_10295 [Ginsengibacter sp.]